MPLGSKQTSATTSTLILCPGTPKSDGWRRRGPSPGMMHIGLRASGPTFQARQAYNKSPRGLSRFLRTMSNRGKARPNLVSPVEADDERLVRNPKGRVGRRSRRVYQLQDRYDAFEYLDDSTRGRCTSMDWWSCRRRRGRRCGSRNMYPLHGHRRAGCLYRVGPRPCRDRATRRDGPLPWRAASIRGPAIFSQERGGGT